MDSIEICRVCVEEVNEYWFLFESCVMKPLGTTTPAQIITEFTSIEIVRGDGLPEFVCISCIEALAAAYQIREKCISSDRKLRKLLLLNKSTIAQRAIKQSNQAIQSMNGATSSNVEITPQTALSMDEQNAYETADEKDLPGNEQTGQDQADTFEIEVETVSYSEEYLTNIQQQQYEADDNNDEHKDRPFTVHSEEDIAIDNQTIDMEVQILKTVASEQSVKVEHTENSPNDTQSENKGDGKKKIVCDLCGKYFSNKGNLKAHILLHNNYKPFRCDLCGEEFSRKHNYNVHKLRHSGKRIHQCPECDKSFVSTVNLKHHMIQHSNVKPFKCNRCPMEYSYRTDLVRHKISHTGIYPFACEFCHHKFSRNCSLKKHLPKCKVQIKKRVFKDKLDK
ncbi:zinc finger and BTB domain-containing protein 49-like [Anopheles marshallii]|uniref:zinc finger and BTB domain-containing protein 49-like n=1 Tax=Anopheles marshallii TaxID=1521116 RepID=UPI00237B221C|nr:zinc finger and BTB domain-containing protein 49-like [Anopheles marshallii]